MSRRGRGQSVSRVVQYRVVVAQGERIYNRFHRVYEDNESRCEDLLTAAQRAGLITQWNGSRGFFWWEGRPSKEMRRLRDAIGGEPVRDDDIRVAARKVGNESIAGKQ